MAVSRQPHVLVIDDDPDIRTLLREFLSTEGFAVSEAADGPAALKLVQTCQFDLLITDLRLPPPMNGVQTVRGARKYDPTLRSLFISGVEKPTWDNPDYDDFVCKPFNTRQLIGCIWELLYRHSAQRNTEQRGRG